MNNCCLNCPHEKIEDFYKKMYNIYASPTFNIGDCPFTDDDTKLGCMAKEIKIEWDDFKKFLADNGIQ